MAYLSGEKINSFPSTKRASVNKLMTENSVTRLINRLIDSDSYVIVNGLDGVDVSTDIPVGQWNNSMADFEFVIHGYYFSIAASSSASGLGYLMTATGFNGFSDETEHTLYARIFIDKTDSDFPELYGQEEDSTGKYKGVYFYIDSATVNYPDGGSEEDYDVYDAPLVKYMANDEGSFGRYVPLTSLFKFNSSSIKNIDGGEIIL